MANQEGKAQAITVMTPVKPFWTIWLRIVFWIARTFPAFTAPLRQLSFIHYARWNIVPGIPYNGSPQKREKLHYKYLLFTSNFNGTWDAYIDAFSYTVPDKMKQIWGSSYGFPGPLPVQPFKDYIHRNEFEANHYYSAYPGATTTVILAALEVSDTFDSLKERARTGSPEHFKRAYESFLTDNQKYL